MAVVPKDWTTYEQAGRASAPAAVVATVRDVPDKGRQLGAPNAAARIDGFRANPSILGRPPGSVTAAAPEPDLRRSALDPVASVTAAAPLDPGASGWRLSKTAANVAAALSRMPTADRALLEPLLPGLLRKELRGAYLRQSVTDMAEALGLDDAADAWEISGQLRDALRKFRLNPTGIPNNPVRAALHRYLTLTRGKVHCRRHLYRLLTDI